MGRALALLLPLCAALPHRHDVHSILDEIRALKSDIDADESPTLERRVYSNDEAAEEAEQHDDALASAPELEAGTAAAPNENAQWVTSMQIAVDKNLKGDIVAGFNLKPLTGAGAGAGGAASGFGNEGAAGSARPFFLPEPFFSLKTPKVLTCVLSREASRRRRP